MTDHHGWWTLYRIYHQPLRQWVLVQKRDGDTRTITDPDQRP